MPELEDLPCFIVRLIEFLKAFPSKIHKVIETKLLKETKGLQTPLGFNSKYSFCDGVLNRRSILLPFTVCPLKGVLVCFFVVLKQITDAKKLFVRLEEMALLDNHFFLRQLLETIRRADLLSLLETDSMQPEETDAYPMLSQYRYM